MNGITVNNNELLEPPVIHDFVMKTGNMAERIQKLERWTVRRLSDIFKITGCADDIFLSDYLRKVQGLVDKSTTFGEMCDFLFSIPTLQTEEKEESANTPKTRPGDKEIVSHVPGKGYYNSKPMQAKTEAEWVRQVEDGEGIKIFSYAVVIKVKSIIEKYKGGWDCFIQFCKENNYPLITDNKLAATFDGYFPQLHRLLDSLGENGLQAKHGPVDFYLMDPYDSVLAHPQYRDDGWEDVYIGNDTIGTCNDCELEVFLEESSGDAKVKIKEGNWQKHNHIYSKAIELYKLGDMMGSVYEGGPVHYRRYLYDEIKDKYMRGGFRTDESDIVDCFNNFIGEYSFKGELNLLYNWVVYHTKHRAHVKYGRTYQEQFLIVGTLKAHNDLTLERLFELSEDKNSFGNGCLALVYPVYHYAESLNLNMDGRLKLVTNFCRLTHAHPQAISAVTLLYAVIDIAIKGGDIFDPKEYAGYSGYFSQGLKDSLYDFLTGDVDLQPEDFIKKYPDNIMALNTLFYALYSVKNAATMEETITNVISFNGDADSVSALALMLWGMINSEKI